jgi:hypothetical protein
MGRKPGRGGKYVLFLFAIVTVAVAFGLAVGTLHIYPVACFLNQYLQNYDLWAQQAETIHRQVVTQAGENNRKN